jgi:hypothetical protein
MADGRGEFASKSMSLQSSGRSMLAEMLDAMLDASDRAGPPLVVVVQRQILRSS